MNDVNKVTNLIFEFFKAYQGFVGTAIGNNKIFIYVEDKSAETNIQKQVNRYFSQNKDNIKISVCGKIVIADD